MKTTKITVTEGVTDTSRFDAWYKEREEQFNKVKTFYRNKGVEILKLREKLTNVLPVLFESWKIENMYIVGITISGEEGLLAEGRLRMHFTGILKKEPIQKTVATKKICSLFIDAGIKVGSGFTYDSKDNRYIQGKEVKLEFSI